MHDSPPKGTRKVDSLPYALPHFVEPRPGIGAVNHAAEKAQSLGADYRARGQTSDRVSRGHCLGVTAPGLDSASIPCQGVEHQDSIGLAGLCSRPYRAAEPSFDFPYGL